MPNPPEWLSWWKSNHKKQMVARPQPYRKRISKCHNAGPSRCRRGHRRRGPASVQCGFHGCLAASASPRCQCCCAWGSQRCSSSPATSTCGHVLYNKNLACKDGPQCHQRRNEKCPVNAFPCLCIVVWQLFNSCNISSSRSTAAGAAPFCIAPSLPCQTQ